MFAWELIFQSRAQENCVSQLNYDTLSVSTCNLTTFNGHVPFCLFPSLLDERPHDATRSNRERLQDAILHFRSKFIISLDRRWNKEKNALDKCDVLCSLLLRKHTSLTKANTEYGKEIILFSCSTWYKWLLIGCTKIYGFYQCTFSCFYCYNHAHFYGLNVYNMLCYTHHTATHVNSFFL